MLIKFSKFIFHDDVYIWFAYIPHEKSNFHRICDNDFHVDIEKSWLNKYAYTESVKWYFYSDDLDQLR